VKLLLDTHTLIWFLESDKRLSATAYNAIRQTDTLPAVSVVSLWEMTIKVSIGKLSLENALEDVFKRIATVEFELLNIDPDDLLVLSTLPLHHTDPFDRLLAAQSLRLNFSFISRDIAFDFYGINRIW
jgi:PIN domain nuclease of toxin-antitoxin system